MKKILYFSILIMSLSCSEEKNYQGMYVDGVNQLIVKKAGDKGYVIIKIREDYSDSRTSLYYELKDNCFEHRYDKDDIERICVNGKNKLVDDIDGTIYTKVN